MYRCTISKNVSHNIFLEVPMQVIEFRLSLYFILDTCMKYTSKLPQQMANRSHTCTINDAHNAKSITENILIDLPCVYIPVSHTILTSLFPATKG